VLGLFGGGVQSSKKAISSGCITIIFGLPSMGESPTVGGSVGRSAEPAVGEAVGEPSIIQSEGISKKSGSSESRVESVTMVFSVVP